jgi:hypothetical protein
VKALLETRRTDSRFYPDSFPEFDGEPNRHDFAIRRTGDCGLGVVALKKFRKGEVAFSFTGMVTSDVTQHSLQLTNDVHIHDPWFMGFILHSCSP